MVHTAYESPRRTMPECGIRTCAEFCLMSLLSLKRYGMAGILCGPNSLLIKSLAQTFRGLLHNYNILLALFACLLDLMHADIPYEFGVKRGKII